MINYDRKHEHPSDIFLALPAFRVYVHVDVCVWKCVRDERIEALFIIINRGHFTVVSFCIMINYCSLLRPPLMSNDELH